MSIEDRLKPPPATVGKIGVISLRGGNNAGKGQMQELRELTPATLDDLVMGDAPKKDIFKRIVKRRQDVEQTAGQQVTTQKRDLRALINEMGRGAAEEPREEGQV